MIISLDRSIVEGDSGTTDLNFTVTLSQAPSADVTVHYQTADDTAIAGSDYVATSGTLTIPAGSSSGTISVPVNGDLVPESYETFYMDLGSAVNAMISNGRGIGTILNDDSTISIRDASISEGNSGLTNLDFTVALS